MNKAAGAFAVLCLGGCVSSEDVTPVAEGLGEAEAAVWTVEDTTSTRTWNSGRSADLSPWLSVDCFNDQGEDHLLTGLQAFEDSGSADRFTAKLVAECSGYTELYGNFVQDGRHENDTVFSANHKSDTGEWTHVPSERYPVGVVIETDLSNDYIQTMRVSYVRELSDGSLGDYDNPTVTSTVGPGGVIIGPLETLTCRDQYVMTGLKLRYDTQKGKVRILTITCRPLTDS